MTERLRAWTEDAPANLAVFRVVVGVVLLRLPDLHRAVQWAALPDRVRTPPVGLEWTIGVVPMGPEVARPLYWIVVVATGLGTVGLFTRAAWTVVALGSLWLLAIPQYAGSVFHYHHLVWFAMLLAASPSGDALSIEARIARGRGRARPPARSLAYGVPIRAAWLLIALIFFFPGVHKLLESGGAWIWSDNLRNQMYAKWLQMDGFTPLYRIDRHPTLVRLGALGTVLFELSFVGFVLFRRTRLVAVAIAMLFHQATAYLMGLRFPALWITYVVFIDWVALAERARAWWTHARSRSDSDGRTSEESLAKTQGRKEGQRAGTATTPRPRLDADSDADSESNADSDSDSDSDPRPVPSNAWPRAALVVAAVLLAGNTVVGAAGLSDAWPFACYPKFHRTVRARLPALRVEVVAADGRVETIPVRAMSPEGATQRWWAVTWSLMGAHERARAEPARFAAFWRAVSRQPEVRRRAEGAIAVRFHRDVVSTIPEEREAPPLSTRLLYVLSLR